MIDEHSSLESVCKLKSTKSIIPYEHWDSAIKSGLASIEVHESEPESLDSDAQDETRGSVSMITSTCIAQPISFPGFKVM